MTLYVTCIPLKGGGCSIVDSDLAPTVCGEEWKLNDQGYVIAAKFKGRRQHKLVYPTARFLDHVSGDKQNNLRLNLRPCTSQENSFNRGKRKTGGSSKFKGVSLHKPTGLWRAYISHNKKKIHLGLFELEENAAKAYDKSAVELFGEFARTNFPKRRN